MTKNYSWCYTWIKGEEEGEGDSFWLLQFRSEDRGSHASSCDTTHMGGMCVLMDMQKYPNGISKVSRRCRFQPGLKAKDGTLADEVSKNILLAEIAWERCRDGYWLFCEDNRFLWQEQRGKWKCWRQSLKSIQANLESNCEGLADGFVLYFPCNAGSIRRIWVGDCLGKLRGHNLDINCDIFSLKLLKHHRFIELKRIGRFSIQWFSNIVQNLSFKWQLTPMPHL